jgi:hypothetical protein
MVAKLLPAVLFFLTLVALKKKSLQVCVKLATQKFFEGGEKRNKKVLRPNPIPKHFSSSGASKKKQFLRSKKILRLVFEKRC